MTGVGWRPKRYSAAPKPRSTSLRSVDSIANQPLSDGLYPCINAGCKPSPEIEASAKPHITRVQTELLSYQQVLTRSHSSHVRALAHAQQPDVVASETPIVVRGDSRSPRVGSVAAGDTRLPERLIPPLQLGRWPLCIALPSVIVTVIPPAALVPSSFHPPHFHSSRPSLAAPSIIHGEPHRKF